MSARIETGLLDPSATSAERLRTSTQRDGRAAEVADAIQARYTARDYLMRRTLVAADALGIVLAATVALLVGQDTPVTDVWLVVPTLPFWLLLFGAYGLYKRDVKKVNHAVLDDVPNLFHALVIGGLALWVVYQIGPGDRLAAFQVLVFGVAGLALIPLLRAAARKLVSRSLGPQRVLFLGDSPAIPALTRKMQQHREYGLLPIGQVRSNSDSRNPLNTLPHLGSLLSVDFRRLVAEQRVDRVIVATDDVDDHEMLRILQQCRAQALKVSILPDHVHAMGPAVQIADVEGITLLDLNPLVLPRSSRMLKRIVDIVGAGLLLVVFAPVMAVIALAIRIDGPGPILFRQDRVGRGGTHFRLLKFRTMVPDAESRAAELRHLSQDPTCLKLEHDPRITRVGRFLRVASLDELPQLWNVIRGDMSLVGPRPLVEAEDRRVSGWERSRLDLAPGITGPWQVMGRTNIPFEEMTKLDYMYVTNWSLWTDLKLVLRTLPTVLSRRGAN